MLTAGAAAGRHLANPIAHGSRHFCSHRHRRQVDHPGLKGIMVHNSLSEFDHATA
jgi:hypothetical protein